MSSRHPAQREPQDPAKKAPQRFPPRRQRDPTNDNEIPVRKAPTRERQGGNDRQPPQKR